MTLHPCRDCGINVSSSAESCPECGATKPHQSEAEINRKDNANKWLVVFIVVIFIVAWVVDTAMEDHYNDMLNDIRSGRDRHYGESGSTVW